MAYKIFLDDERYPVTTDWIVCRNMVEFTQTIRDKGMPFYISFDHDLGENEPTGYDIVKWLVEMDLDGHISIKDLEFYVHSQNPVGKQNIEKYLKSYLKTL